MRTPLVLALCGALASCSTNEWLLSRVYNQLDDRIVDRYSQYAEFDDSQLAWIEQAADAYHDWHRHTQVRHYVAFLRQIDSELAGSDMVDQRQVDKWSGQIAAFSRALQTCNPLNGAHYLLQSLTDAQVRQIGTHIAKTHEEFLHQYDKKDWVRERNRNAFKWFRRIGLDLNEQQRALLAETLDHEHEFRLRGWRLWRDWGEQLVLILERRDAPAFRSTVQRHLSRLWKLSSQAYPEDTKRSVRRWNRFLEKMLNLQTGEQRHRFRKWLTAMAEALETIAGPARRVTAYEAYLPAKECTTSASEISLSLEAGTS